jgi:hypothetical protein
MTSIEHEFIARADRIPYHGLGLSVDVYQPDLFELADALNRRGPDYGYLEIFKAAPAALESVRRRMPDTLFSYHAEGLWVTQPNPETLSPFHAELDDTAEQLRILGSHWLNHECAAKQMAGYAFGTYLPALFTVASAEVTADNIAQAQQRLDRTIPEKDGMGPLFLLETPPLTYVGFGDLGMAEFFRLVTDRTPCGVVLDIGHLWTVYRYTGEWRRRPLTDFLAEFLDTFPLKRVVEIHMAGLALHPSVPSHKQAAGEPPLWIDAHGAPIPEMLSDMLAQVLERKGLTNLKGVALEVDTKPIDMIVEEFAKAHARFGPTIAHERRDEPGNLSASVLSIPPVRSIQSDKTDQTDRTDRMDRIDMPASLAEQYALYVQIVTGQTVDGLPVLGGDASALPLYNEHYLPHEILEWGGAVREMFPEACRDLDRAGIALEAFVRFWFREPRAARPVASLGFAERRALRGERRRRRATDQAYDFFLLKIARFVEFVRDVLPDSLDTVEREAAVLRDGYRAANEMIGTGN